MNRKVFDVVIVGLGVTGTAIMWVLALFTNVKRLCGLEKYGRVATVNSHPLNNAQTSHDGGTETNYTLKHALKVLKAALKLRAYVRMRSDKTGLFHITDRMVLGVGESEVRKLRERYTEFAPHYPDLRIVEADELRVIEPKVMEGRDSGQPVCALVSKEGYAINYQLLAECFLEDAHEANHDIELRFNTEVKSVTRGDDGMYTIHTSGGDVSAKVVVFSAGAYSLFHAQKLGYGLNLGILSVAGSFFSAGKQVRGKVYRPQVAGRPFAELHIDKDVLSDESRIGPTTKPVLLMERYNLKSFWDYIKLPIVSFKGFLIANWILLRNGLVWYVFMNALYDVPVVGKYLFLKKAQDTIPTLRYSDLKRRKGAGGVRPQIVDMDTWKLEMGERTIVGDNLIFNTTPSPGASVCIENATERDVPQIISFLGEGFWFDKEKLHRTLGLDHQI